MRRRYISFALLIAVMQVATGSIYSATKPEQAAARLARVKAEVAKRGTGEKARIRIKTAGGERIEGFIQKSEDDSFVLMESKTCQPMTIAYSAVAGVEGKQWSTSQKILFVWISLAVVSIVLFPNGKD